MLCNNISFFFLIYFYSAMVELKKLTEDTLFGVYNNIIVLFFLSYWIYTASVMWQYHLPIYTFTENRFLYKIIANLFGHILEYLD